MTIMYLSDIDHDALEQEYREIYDITSEENLDHHIGFNNWCNSCSNQDWEDFWDQIPETNCVLATLVFNNRYPELYGKNTGKICGGGIETNLKKMISRAINKRDGCKIYIDNDRTFKIDAYHHDGTDHFSLYELTKKGEDYIKNRDWGDRLVHEHLVETKGLLKKIKNWY